MTTQTKSTRTVKPKATLKSWRTAQSQVQVFRALFLVGVIGLVGVFASWFATSSPVAFITASPMAMFAIVGGIGWASTNRRKSQDCAAIA